LTIILKKKPNLYSLKIFFIRIAKYNTKQYKEAIVDLEAGKDKLKNESDAKIKMFDDWIAKCKDKLPKETPKQSDPDTESTNNIATKPTAPPPIKYYHFFG
jgi:hypothetical protein